MAEVKLSKWGNSSGIRFPKEILNQLGMSYGKTRGYHKGKPYPKKRT